MGKGKLSFYRFTQKFKNFLISSIGILHEGFLLGVLNNNDLKEITQMYYESAQLYQDDEYNLSGLYDWEQRAVDTFFKDCKNVLVGSAGAGREVIALSRMGIRVDAFECNPRLVDESRHLVDKAGITASITLATPDTVPEQFGIYDGMVIGWGGYMHIIGSDTRIRFLKECRKHIKPEGPVLLSFFTFHGDSRYQDAVFRIAAFIRAIRMSREAFESGDSLKFGGFCHMFSEKEIEDELNSAGFDLIFFSSDEYSHAVGKAGREGTGGDKEIREKLPS